MTFKLTKGALILGFLAGFIWNLLGEVSTILIIGFPPVEVRSLRLIRIDGTDAYDPVDDDYNEIYLPCSCMKITYW